MKRIRQMHKYPLLSQRNDDVFLFIWTNYEHVRHSTLLLDM